MSGAALVPTLALPTKDSNLDEAGSGSTAGRSSRRALLLASVGATGAMVAQALGQPLEASAASVQLGATNTSTKATVFNATRHSSTAKALVGQVTYTGSGGGTAGVEGISKATSGNGVLGVANHGSNAYGVYGTSTTGTGVVGFAPRGVAGIGDLGVYGETTATLGVGVKGVGGGGDSTWGVYGYVNSGTGVQGETGNSASWGALGAGYNGVYAETNGDTAVYAYNLAGHLGWAGYFDGDVYIDTLYTLTPLSQVDHPDAPGERWYRTALVGSFERVDVISGNARTGSDGRVSVRVPEEFARYHGDFRYQLTPVGVAAVPFIAKGMARGRFVIGTERPGTKVSWQVTAIRTDPAARDAAFQVSVRKDAAERGRFLQPRLYGKSARRGIKRPLTHRRPSAARQALKDVDTE